MRPLHRYLLLTFAGLGVLTASLYGLRMLVETSPEFALQAREWVQAYGYMGIFTVTLIGGTVIPLASPAFVAYAAGLGMDRVPLVMWATFGNTVGVAFNYYLAMFLGMKFVEKRMGRWWFEEMTRWWSRWGVLLLIIFGVVPVLPFDLLALLAGLFHMKIHWFLLITVTTRVVQFGIFALLGEVTMGP